MTSLSSPPKLLQRLADAAADYFDVPRVEIDSDGSIVLHPGGGARAIQVRESSRKGFLAWVERRK